MEEKESFTLEDLAGIVETLRGENGCPWDGGQTHGSLKPYMMEEAAELVSSIRIYEKTGNAENMREELGDVLFHVVMHSRIAEEEGLFTLQDVIGEISRKMIRRHPHVFSGGVQAGNAEEITAGWEEIKRREKEGKVWIESPLREIPRELPALTRAAKVMKKADRLYGAGKDYADNVARLQESARELAQLQPEADGARLERVMADMLAVLSDIAGRHHVSQEQILTDRIEDLIDKYEPM